MFIDHSQIKQGTDGLLGQIRTLQGTDEFEMETFELQKTLQSQSQEIKTLRSEIESLKKDKGAVNDKEQLRTIKESFGQIVQVLQRSVDQQDLQALARKLLDLNEYIKSTNRDSQANLSY